MRALKETGFFRKWDMNGNFVLQNYYRSFGVETCADPDQGLRLSHHYIDESYTQKFMFFARLSSLKQT